MVGLEDAGAWGFALAMLAAAAFAGMAAVAATVTFLRPARDDELDLMAGYDLHAGLNPVDPRWPY